MPSSLHLGGTGLRPSHERALRHRVGRAVAPAFQCADGRDAHDAPVAARPHRTKTRRARRDRGQHVVLPHLAHETDVERRPTFVRAGQVVEDVDAPPRTQHALDERVHRAGVRGIGFDHEQTRVVRRADEITERRCERRAFGGVAHRCGDMCPTREIRAHDRCSEIAGRASDDRRVRRKIEHAPVVWA